MFERLRQRVEREERGFTLIELMVVVLIIAILIAIAIPTFLGARQRAQDRAAQSNVRNALTAEKTFFTDGQVYSETASDLTAIEPSLNYTNAAASMSSKISLIRFRWRSSAGCWVCPSKRSRNSAMRRDCLHRHWTRSSRSPDRRRTVCRSGSMPERGYASTCTD